MTAPTRGASRGAGGRRRSRPWAWAFAAAVALQLVVLYAPRAPSGGEVHGLDKVVHVSVFALVVLTGRAAGLRPGPLVALCLVHAVVSEVVQATLLPHRDGDWRDASADAVGVVLAALVTRRPARGRP